jgi:hypothetical protein
MASLQQQYTRAAADVATLTAQVASWERQAAETTRDLQASRDECRALQTRCTEVRMYFLIHVFLLFVRLYLFRRTEVLLCSI